MNNEFQSSQDDIRKKIYQARAVMIIPSALAAISGLAFICFDRYNISDLGPASHFNTTLISGSFFVLFVLITIPCLLLGLNDIRKAKKAVVKSSKYVQ
jgi:hypothetical protein